LTPAQDETPLTQTSSGVLCVIFAVLYAVVFIASLVVVPVLAPAAKIPNPFGPDDLSRSFFLHNAEAIRVSAFLQLISACCLAGLSACMAAIQRRVGASFTAPALTLVGGVGGAGLLALTALCSWAISSPGAVDPGPAFHTLQFLPFLMGGPGWAGFFALFLTGAAMGGKGLLPRLVNGFGYFLAVVSALATLVLLTIYAAPCLPAARFLGFVWIIVAAVMLVRRAGKAARA
jgi:hypothetical protein